MTSRPPCASRRKFADAESARRALGEIWARPDPGARLPSHTYPCDDHWHISKYEQLVGEDHAA